MFRIVSRTLLCLSVILAMTFSTGIRVGAASTCPSATMPAEQGHGGSADTQHVAAKGGAVAHHGHVAMPEPCKHGCTVLGAMPASMTERLAPAPRLVLIRHDASHPFSRQPPPVERPPKPMA